MEVYLQISSNEFFQKMEQAQLDDTLALGKKVSFLNFFSP